MPTDHYYTAGLPQALDAPGKQFRTQRLIGARALCWRIANKRKMEVDDLVDFFSDSNVSGTPG